MTKQQIFMNGVRLAIWIQVSAERSGVSSFAPTETDDRGIFSSAVYQLLFFFNIPRTLTNTFVDCKTGNRL